jgi:hypothetical protein
MSQTTALFASLDGTEWVAGHFKSPDDVVTLLQAAALERDELLEDSSAGGGILHAEPPRPPADGALVLYDRARSRFFRARDGLHWDLDVHNPITTRGGAPTLNCYYSAESEPRADGTRLHRRTYWLKDGTRGVALVQYRRLREAQTRRRTKRPTKTAQRAAAAAGAQAAQAAALAWLAGGVLRGRLGEASSPLLYLNTLVGSVQLGRSVLCV